MEGISLSDAEWTLMQVLWRRGASTLRELTDEVEQEHGWDKHSVISFLKRMEQKGAIRIEHTVPKRYCPLLDRAETVRAETRSVLGRVYGGDVTLMVQSAVRGGQLSREEIEELARLLMSGGDGE